MFAERAVVEARLSVVLPVTERLVVDALAEVNVVIVPDADERSFMVALVIVVVAKVDTPATERVPFEIREEVAVTTPPVRLEPVSVDTTVATAERRLVKKFVDVACVVVSVVIVADAVTSVVAVVVASDVTPVNVLSPPNDCDDVETRPRDVVPAFGRLSVCVLPTEEILVSDPELPIVKNWDKALRPLKDVIPPEPSPIDCHDEPLFTNN